MLPIQICRHWHVEWLGSHDCVCQGCGKVGHWFDGMVLWQRRPTSRIDRALPAIVSELTMTNHPISCTSDNHVTLSVERVA